MLTIKIPQHDKGYQEKFTIYTDGTQTQVQNLTDYTVKCKAWAVGNPATLIVDSICTIDENPASGICYWTISPTATANIGSLRAELQLEKAGIVMSTLPFQISILESAE